MRQITSEHTADITRLLQKLVGQGALMQDGQGRWTRYRLPREPDSLHRDLHSLHKTEQTNNELDKLSSISESARQNKRLSTKQMESILLQLCEKHWLTRRNLAELLQRNEESLRSRFLAPMVEHGLLLLRYPEKPNRADQAYTKASHSLEKEK